MLDVQLTRNLVLIFFDPHMPLPRILKMLPFTI
jgi:hypothetical protein